MTFSTVLFYLVSVKMEQGYQCPEKKSPWPQINLYDPAIEESGVLIYAISP